MHLKRHVNNVLLELKLKEYIITFKFLLVVVITVTAITINLHNVHCPPCAF
jgi:hypothetical protein